MIHCLCASCCEYYYIISRYNLCAIFFTWAMIQKKSTHTADLLLMLQCVFWTCASDTICKIDNCDVHKSQWIRTMLCATIYIFLYSNIIMSFTYGKKTKLLTLYAFCIAAYCVSFVIQFLIA